MIKLITTTLMFMGLFTFNVMASDVNCCMACCKGATCIMTHKEAHNCGPAGTHPPCK